MPVLTALIPNYKQRYGDFSDPLPEENTIADYLPFLRRDSRPGYQFNMPLVMSFEQGQTADITGGAFTLNAAIDAVLQNANLDGATLMLRSTIPYDASFSSRNGAGNGSSGGAFREIFELKTDLLMKGMEFYRELSMLYGCGTAAAAAANIGAFSAITGAAAAGTFTLTTATWAPGIWTNMYNAKIDIYQSDLTTQVTSGATITAINPDTRTITFSGGGASGGTYANTNVVVPFGWRTKTCVGLAGILSNTGTLFGINAATFPVWKALQLSASAGPMSQLKVMGLAARVGPNGVTNGGKLFVSGPSFADMANELMANQRYTQNTDSAKRTGAATLEYVTPAGVIQVALHKYMKQGEAMFIPRDAGIRVGSTDITFRGEGDDWFFQEMQDTAACQIRIASSQAPFIKKPFQCAYITSIVNSAGSGVV